MWIAFKKLYLWYSEQLRTCRKRWRMSCELLSKNCIFDILNNNTFWMCKALEVVNCFQKIVSLIFWTTFKFNNPDQVWLWIAFKKLYLWYSEQPKKQGSKDTIVVNCFQKIVSLIFWTTNTIISQAIELLWIAFKKLYLWYSEQPLLMIGSACYVVNCFQKIVSLIF